MKKTIGALALLSPHIAQAQDMMDSEIIVTAVMSEDRVAPQQLILDGAAIDEKQPAVVSDILRGISGLSLRQNSRGETVVRIRSGEERQTPVFLDGAPLATPWDGRVDLGILPAGIIRNISVVRSAAPIEYGANAIAGVIDLGTQPPLDEELIRAEITGGTGNFIGLSGLAVVPVGADGNITLAATYQDKDYDWIADKSAILFDPSTNNRRSNSDQYSASIFAAYSQRVDIGEFRVSLLHVDAERGIGAEGNVDPQIDSPRFWRYPKWQMTQANAAAQIEINDSLDLRTVLWAQWFEQDIDSFTDYSYSAIDERENGRDRSFGGRATLTQEIGDAAIRLSASALQSTHRQSEYASSNGSVAGLIATGQETFRQKQMSIGAEADLPLGQYIQATIGASMDRSETPLTGDKPAQKPLNAPGFSMALRWQPSSSLTVTGSVAQRTRFPTLRESFGQALGRFLINPDIKPERSRMVDIGVQWTNHDAISGNLTLWANDSKDSLGQRAVRINGRKLRQRYNMRGSFTYGAEASFNIDLTDNLSAEASAAFQSGKPKSERGVADLRLVQQVDRQLNFALDWTPTARLDIRAEYQHLGKAYDLDDNGDFLALPTANVLNFRSFWKAVKFSDERALSINFSIDNIGDALVLPQLGLPAPGRAVRLGLKIEI